MALLTLAVIAAAMAAGLFLATASGRPEAVAAPQQRDPTPEPEIGLEAVAGGVLKSVSLLTEGVEHSVSGLVPLGPAVEDVWVTHYGESFNGQAMGCDATPYSSENAGIVAVGAERSEDWPCGTILRICGPGSCILAQRSDGCGGCGPYHVDLSEEGLQLVCGPGSGVCQASVEALHMPCQIRGAERASAQGGPLQLFATLAETALSDRTAGLLDLTQDEIRGEACAVRGPYAPPIAQP
jgi:hypothetical protein